MYFSLCHYRLHLFYVSDLLILPLKLHTISLLLTVCDTIYFSFSGDIHSVFMCSATTFPISPLLMDLRISSSRAMLTYLNFFPQSCFLYVSIYQVFWFTDFLNQLFSF